MIHLVLAIVAIGIASPAWAQTQRVQGPFAGLFGARSTSTQTLSLRASIFAAYQDTVLPPDADTAQLDRRFDHNGAFVGGAAGLSYSFARNGEGSSFFVGAQGSVSQSSIDPDVLPWSLSLNTGVSTNLTRRIHLTISGDAGYAPVYGFQSLTDGYQVDTGFAADPALVGQGSAYAAAAEPTVELGGVFGVTGDLSSRSTLSVQGSFDLTRPLRSPDSAFQSLDGDVTFHHRLTRSLGFHAGYGRQVRTSSAPGTERVVGDTIDGGLDYSGSFSLGRRTTVTFGTSTGVVSTGDDSRFRVNGNAGIRHAMGRTWSASASYLRDVDYVAGFYEPVFSDWVSASIGGQIAPRLSSSSSVSWESGLIGFDAAAGNFDTYSATTGLQLGVRNGLGVYLQYGYFYYQVPPGSSSLDLLSSYSRQSVSAGLTVYVPVLNTGRGRLDSR